jgi:hypothetical protein
VADPSRIAFGRQVYDYFIARGMKPHQAAAVAGNMAWEGGGRSDLVNPGDNWKNSPNSPHSVGIGQWNDRAPALIQFARSQGLDVPQGDTRDQRYMQDVIRRIPLETQLAFSWNEMQGPERRAYQRISEGGDLRSATAGAIGYHRPAGFTWSNPEAGHGFSNRLSLASAIMGGGDSPAQPQGSPVTPVSQSPVRTASAQGNDAMLPMLAQMLGMAIPGMGTAAAAGSTMAGGGSAGAGMGGSPMGGGTPFSMGGGGGGAPSGPQGDSAGAQSAMRTAAGQPDQSMFAGPAQAQRPVDLQQLMASLAKRQKLGLGG